MVDGIVASVYVVPDDMFDGKIVMDALASERFKHAVSVCRSLYHEPVSQHKTTSCRDDLAVTCGQTL